MLRFRFALAACVATMLLMFAAQAGADWFAAARSGDLAKVTKMLAANPRLVNSSDNKGMTALHYAADAGSVAVTKFLLENKADPNIADRKGARPLHQAAGRGKADVVRILLAHGADCNAKKLDGVSPLMVAANFGQVEIVDLLLGAGADTAATDASGRTALSIADKAGKTDVVSTLQQAEGDVIGEGDIFGGAGEIRAVVLDTNRQPVPGATVSTGDRAQSSTTDGSGVALLSGLNTGVYSLSVFKQGYAGSNQTQVFVTSGETSEVEVVLVATTGTISGAVLDSKGVGVPGIAVATQDGRFSGVTDSSGRYTISDVPPGTYTVVARREGKDLRTTDKVVVLAGLATPTNFVLRGEIPVAAISITILILALITGIVIVGVRLHQSRTEVGIGLPAVGDLVARIMAMLSGSLGGGRKEPPGPADNTPVVTAPKPVEESGLAEPGFDLATPVAELGFDLAPPEVEPAPRLQPTVVEDDQWCLIGKSLVPETVEGAHMRRADQVGTVTIVPGAGTVRIALRGLPPDQLKALLRSQLLALALLPVRIVWDVVMFCLNLVGIVMAFFGMFTGNFLSISFAMRDTAYSFLAILLDAYAWLETALETIKIARAMSSGTPYALVPNGARVRDGNVLEFSSSDSVQALRLDLTLGFVQESMKRRPGCLGALLGLILLPINMLRCLFTKPRDERVDLFAFVVGKPYDLQPATGVISKRMKMLKRWAQGGFLSSRKVFLVSVSRARAADIQASLEAALGKQIQVADNQFMADRLWN